jgi:glycosyltransferase involved in cell wall biosynthesis
MATYEPPAELLQRQLDSLRAQTYDDWVCVISDDGSGDEAFARIERLTGSDPRFAVSRSPERAGAYANFARVLAMVPKTATYVALCDQDDHWYPDKLETLVAELGDARMAFSDMQLTRADGSVIADTYWTDRQPNHDNYGSLLLGNSVTGAASLFRRELLDEALPLPPRAGNLYHDHWLALVAAARGPIAYVDRPLYDYVQHGEAVIGHAGANVGVVGGGVIRRLAALRGRERGRLREEWRRIYFAEYCRAALTAVALEQRLGPAIGARQRRAIRLVLAAERSPRALAWLAARQLRRPFHDDTGGSESGILRGLAWRRALALRRGRDPLDDADLPPGIVGVDPTPATLPANNNNGAG